jgi:hypothetical protein
MRRHLLPLTLLLAALICFPAFAAKKDKTRGLPPASGNNVPEVNDQPMKDAKVRLAQAQGRLERAQEAMTKTLADLRRQSDTSPAVIEAQSALRQAQADYDAATGPILEKVRATREYETALDAKKAAAQRVLDLQSESSTEQEQINQAARVVLEKGRAVTELESKALSSDPKVAALKEKLAGANARLLKVRRDLEQSIKNDPQLISAKKDVEQAQSEVQPLQSAYNSELQKYNNATIARDRAQDNAPRNSTENDGKGYGRMKKKI